MPRAVTGHIDAQTVVRVFQVDRRRDDVVVHREDAEDRLDGAGRAEQVPGHRLGAGDDGVCADGLDDGEGLADIAGRGRGGVRVHVRDVGRGDALRRAIAVRIARICPAWSGAVM